MISLHGKYNLKDYTTQFATFCDYSQLYHIACDDLIGTY